MPLILPVGENGDVSFTVWGRGRRDGRAVPVPRFVGITIEDGRAVSSDIPVLNWGDVIEAEAEPFFIREPPKTDPGVLGTAETVFGGSRVRAELFYDNGLNIAYTRDGAPPVSVAIGEGENGSIRTLDAGSARYLVVRADVCGGKRLVILDGEGAVTLDVRGADADVVEGYPTVTERLGSVRGLERRTRFKLVKGTCKALPSELGFFTGEEHIPESDTERALSIAEDVLFGRESGWRAFLSEELSETLQNDSLKTFFGDYDAARPHPVEERDGRVTVGLYSKKDHIASPRRFLFVFEGGLLTDVEET
ncbi:MAG: hypothetical protein J5854_00750 [Clostridia bacterium]|nr:hypothetical protein [Clostridia bacterium]